MALSVRPYCDGADGEAVEGTDDDVRQPSLVRGEVFSLACAEPSGSRL